MNSFKLWTDWCACGFFCDILFFSFFLSIFAHALSRSMRIGCIGILWLVALLLKSFAATASCVGDTIDCDGLHYVVMDGDSTLCLVAPSEGYEKSTVVIPAKVEGSKCYQVTAIASRVFYNNDSLTKVTLPVTLETIGDEAFAGATRLCGSMIVPEGVTSVGDHAFARCVSLRSLSLPSTIVSLGAGALECCEGLDTVFTHVPNADVLLQQLPPGVLLCVDENYIESYRQYDGSLKVLVDVDADPRSANLCDVDCDGVVTAADVTRVYNNLLTNDGSPSDADGDGEITACDVTVIYNAILNGITSGVGDRGYCFATYNNGNAGVRVRERLNLPISSEMCIVAHDNERQSLVSSFNVMSGVVPWSKMVTLSDGQRAFNINNKSYNTGTTTQLVMHLDANQDTIYYKDVQVKVARHVVTDTLRVLSIGNSYSLDALSYVPYIMKAVAPQIYLKLDIMYIGGGSLNEFYNALDSTTWAPVDYGTPTSFIHYWSHGAKPWDGVDDVPMTDVIASHPWDVIVLQQQSNASRDYSTYQPYLSQIMGWIDEKVTWQHEYAWLITPSYPDNLPRLAPDTTSVQMFERILECVRNVQSDTGIDLLLPCGTAIQNARTTPLDSLGDFGHLFDYIHLQDGIPCLIEAYAACAALLERYGLSDRVWSDNTWIDQQWLIARNIQEINGAPVGMSEENRAIAKQCAIKAIENPLSITTIE